MINNVIDLVYEDNVINKSVVYVYCVLGIMVEWFLVWDLYLDIYYF